MRSRTSEILARGDVMSATATLSLEQSVHDHVEQLQAELQDQDHPSLEELEAYASDRLPNHRKDELADHLSICADCGDLLRYGVPGELRPIGQGQADEIDADDADLDKAWAALSQRLSRTPFRESPLSEIIAGRRLPLAEVLSLGRTIAEKLAKIHTSGTGALAESLRPENVLIDTERKVVSFRRLQLRTLSASPEDSEEFYQEGMIRSVCGASPEQVAGEDLDYRSDLFSLGSLLYELLTEVSPFRGSTPLDTASRVLVLDPLPASDFRAEIPTALDTLLQRLMSKERDQRPRSAAVVATVLSSIQNDAPNPLAALDEEGDKLEAEIETLYRHIDALTAKQRADDSAQVAAELSDALARLRDLQQAEATQFREEFEARLTMPIDAGDQILRRAKKLREKLEDLTASNPSTL